MCVCLSVWACVCFCCCCISQCPVHLEGYSRPLDRSVVLAKHFSRVCVCVCVSVCVCHFEGENHTDIKVKRPTVLVRKGGEGEEEGGERGRWIDRGVECEC